MSTLVKERDLLRLSTAGSVDDGKSTLIGRMLYDSKQIFQDQMEQLENTSRLRGEESVNLALLTDGLRAEREQGITIDVAYRYFSTARRKFIIADTPGHEQYTRNMVTGASTADLAIILIDARNGVLTQSKRHGIIASLLSIPHVMVAVNKMDLVDYSKDRYEEICAEYREFAQKLSVSDLEFIPISALNGDNVVERSRVMDWYQGAPLLQYLENVTISADRNLVDFRFPVQYVIRPHQDYRGFAGRITSGTIKQGEEVIALPGGQRSRVRSIDFFTQSMSEAQAGQSVTLSLEDEIDISRGDMIVRSHNVPQVETEFEAVLTWMDGDHQLDTSREYILQHTTRRTKAFVDRILYKIDVNTLHRADAQALALNEIGRVKLTTANPVFYDAYDRNRETGGFILIDSHDYRTVAAGMIRHSSPSTMEALRREERTKRAETDAAGKPAVFWDPGYVGLEERMRRNGHRPRVVWFTGLSGAGKSTIAKELEKELWDQGVQVTRVDGDNLRHGLSADLGFSREDRKENIRRAGHLAWQLYNVGSVVLCTFVSPYREDRDEVRRLFPEGDFVEVYVKVSLKEARRRDPKGLYARAFAGEIAGFTGVDAPYEEPEAAEVVIESDGMDAAQAVDVVMNKINSGEGSRGRNMH